MITGHEAGGSRHADRDVVAVQDRVGGGHLIGERIIEVVANPYVRHGPEGGGRLLGGHQARDHLATTGRTDLLTGFEDS